MSGSFAFWGRDPGSAERVVGATHDPAARRCTLWLGPAGDRRVVAARATGR